MFHSSIATWQITRGSIFRMTFELFAAYQSCTIGTPTTAAWGSTKTEKDTKLLMNTIGGPSASGVVLSHPKILLSCTSNMNSYKWIRTGAVHWQVSNGSDFSKGQWILAHGLTGEVFLQDVQGFLIATWREPVLSALAGKQKYVHTFLTKDFDVDTPGRNE